MLPLVPEQVVGLATVPKAIVGVGFTVIVVPVDDAEVHPPEVTVAVYVPLVVTVMD